MGYRDFQELGLGFLEVIFSKGQDYRLVSLFGVGSIQQAPRMTRLLFAELIRQTCIPDSLIRQGHQLVCRWSELLARPSAQVLLGQAISCLLGQAS